MGNSLAKKIPVRDNPEREFTEILNRKWLFTWLCLSFVNTEVLCLTTRYCAKIILIDL